MDEQTKFTAQIPDRKLMEKIADTIRFLSADAVQKANSGHPGMPMGAAEIAAVLLSRFLRIDPKDDKWMNRDRFVLSAGHASMLLYSMLHLAGILTMEDIKNFRQLGSRTPGHPEFGITPGVDASTGPLGAGLSMAAGMAASECMLASLYNTAKFDVIDHYTYVLCGDGCNMEGVVYEAASLAGHLGLGKLIVIYDSNKVTIDGPTDVTFTEDVGARYVAMGWHVQHIDGQDVEAVASAIEVAQAEKSKPSIIIASTTIGLGSPAKAGKSSAHGEPLGAEDLAAAKAARGWPSQDFYIPQEVSDFFDVRRGEWLAIRQNWNALYAAYEKKHRAIARELNRVMAGELPKQWKLSVTEFEPGQSVATRSAGHTVMNQLGTVLPELVGGSADLTPSNKTEIKTGDYPEFITQGMFHGRNIHFGIREHAMGGFVNGMALHGGQIPYCSTFMVFHDYMRPPVRLAALMGLRSIFVYTHDSFMVGEDGPTHQPVEHLASMRAIPNLRIWRPCDANETAWAWRAAVEHVRGPSVLALTRQNIPVLDRTKYTAAKESLKGMYILDDEKETSAEIMIIATGSEVHLALQAAEALRTQGRKIRVVSAPCLEVFKEQAEGYRKKVLPKRLRRRVVIEAGIIQGWEGILGDMGIFVGMSNFGESGKPGDVAARLGFTPQAVVEKILAAGW